MLERNQKVAICRNVFRILIGQKKKDKFQRYSPCIEGALPAFNHSSNNLKKLLKAGFEVFRQVQHGNGKFSEEPFRQQFPNNTEISTQRWRHTYKALRENLRSYNLDPNTDWTKHRTFLLAYAGVYQGWLNPDKAVPSEDFVGGRKDHKKVKKFVTDLYNVHKNEIPSIPALGMRKDLNGLNTPSTEGGVGTVPSMERPEANADPWTRQEKYDVSHKPTSPNPQPIFGELNK